MMLAGASFGSTALASETPLSPTPGDAEALRPFRLYIGGMEMSTAYIVGSGNKAGAIGEQGTLQFQLKNGAFSLNIGMPIRWLYYSEVLFDGMLTRWTSSIEPSQSDVRFNCTATDWSVLLSRHIINRNFINASLITIVDSLLDNELAGNGLSIGSIESWLSLPLVDSQGSSALDVLRDAGAALGMVLMVDNDKRIHLRSTTLPSAPFTIDENLIEDILNVDNTTENYRNVQTVIVTGTSSDASSALEVSYTAENTDQIAERAAIEGNDGRYETVDTLTHPTSNAALDLQLLAQGYAEAKLATAGAIQQTITCLVRGYGWEAGQLVSLSHLLAGLSGTFTIQKVDVTEIDAILIRSRLTLTPDTLRQRAYQAWLRLIDRGKVVVQLPGAAAPVSIVVSFMTPGAVNWTVPAGVFQITLKLTGASASGSGAWIYWTPNDPRIGGCHGSCYNGRKGGNGGYAIATVNVMPGDLINLTVGAKGTPGGSYGEYASGGCSTGFSSPGSGHDATDTTAYRLGVLLAAAYKGTKGIAGPAGTSGTAGTNGSGSGGIVTVGGGKTGGNGGLVSSTSGGSPGQDGKIEIEYIAA